MRYRETMEHSQGVDVTTSVLRRRFLLDLTYPAVSVALCDLFGLPPASEDVGGAEEAEAASRMARLGDNPHARVLIAAVQDMTRLLESVPEKDDAEVWLVAFVLASVNLLEDLGLVKVLPDG